MGDRRQSERLPFILEERRGHASTESAGMLDNVQPLEPQRALESIPKGLAGPTESVLEDARQHLDEFLELPAEKIRLRLEIDP
jgi:hypothetical protein